MKMNQEVRTEWVQALRSGKYDQGEGALKETSDTGRAKYCCLGVLCDLAVKHGIAEITAVDDYGNTFYGTDHANASSAFLPKPVQEWAAVDPSGSFDDDAVYTDFDSGRVLHSLVDMNDSSIKFPKIADYIEKVF